MRNVYLLYFVLIYALPSSAQVYLDSTVLRSEVVADNLETPWEVIWGPDNWLWVTQREGKVVRINPETGETKQLLQLTNVYRYQAAGLLGMALHPNFTDTAQVFIVYTYNVGEEAKEKLVRYSYQNDKLVDPLILIDDIPAATIRNGSRIITTPDRKVIMTTGDINQPKLAQDTSSLNGKTLRVNFDGSIPEDNPTEGSYIWSRGHRNPQGLVLAENGILYSSEHADKSDDEINIIEKGRNYGWIDVQGFCDTPEETEYCHNYQIREAITAWTPSVAPCGLEYYNHDTIPEWKNSLLLATLKHDDLRVLKLSEDGLSITSEKIYFDNHFGRLRDICVAPSGDLYIATSNRHDASANGGFPIPSDDKIIRITVADEPAYSSKNSTVRIFPNPFSAFTSVKVDSKQVSTTINLRFRVYDHTGRVVKDMSVSPQSVTQIDRETLREGSYFYQLLDQNQIVDSGRFLVI